MKKIIILLAASLLILPMSAQFTAKMHSTSMGQERVFTIYSADAGYRYEFNESGMEGVLIVKKGSPEVIILMPQQKMAMKVSATDPMGMGNDPVASYNRFKDEGLVKVEGEETVNGIPCIRAGLYNKDNPTQKIYTVWTSEKYDFPIKLINHMEGTGETTVELKDIKPWTPDAKSFEIPEGYQVMDMPKMIP
jgi:outer membrane lipoprotein-sorting protein